MLRSVFVAGTAVGVLALGGITAAAGSAHPSSLTHLAKNREAAAQHTGGALTALTQALRVTATDAENATAAQAQPTQPQSQAEAPTQAQAQDTQDEDAAENEAADNDATEDNTTEADDVAEQAAAPAPEQPAAPSSGEQEKDEAGGGD